MTCGHLLQWELQNWNPLLNNHQEENVGSHQKKVPHIQSQRRSPKKMVKLRATQLYPTLCNPMDYTVHGILQAGILEWVAFPFYRGSPQSRGWTQVSRIAGRFFTIWATSKMVGGAKSHLESNRIPTRDTQRAQTKPCVHHDPKPHRDWSRPALECLLQRKRSAVACHRDSGSDCSIPGPRSMWHKPSWRSLPLVPPYSHQADENPQRIWLCKPVGLDYRISIGVGKQTLGGHKQNLVHTRNQEKATVSPQKTESDLPMSVQESPVEAWLNSLTSGHATGWEHSPAHQQKIGIKIY